MNHVPAPLPSGTQKQPVHRGPYVSFEGIQAMPRPVQASIPVVVGGRTAPAYRRAVTKGNGWYGFGLDVAETEKSVIALTEIWVRSMSPRCARRRRSSRLP